MNAEMDYVAFIIKCERANKLRRTYFFYAETEARL